MSRQAWATSAAVAVLAGACTALFFACFERRPVEVTRGASAEARLNPYLAAGRLLEGMGHPVRHVPGPLELAELPPPDGVLVFTPNRRTLSPERSAALREWVESGGHLVVEAWELWTDADRRPDLLLDPLGLETHETGIGADGADDDDEAAGDEPGQDLEDIVAEALEAFDTSDLSTLRGADLPRPLTLDFDGRFSWRYTGEAPVRLRATGEWGDHLIAIELGAGLLSAVTDGRFLENEGLADFDHAEALVRLVRLDGRSGPVWIVTSEHWPGLFEQLGRHARPALAAAALWLGFVLWRAARRRGPLLAPEPAARRSWLEHLEAVGRYHWRRDRARPLFETCRQTALRGLEREHPGWGRLAPTERAERLAAASGLEPEAIARALHGVRPDDERAFVSAIRTLERIRNPR